MEDITRKIFKVLKEHGFEIVEFKWGRRRGRLYFQITVKEKKVSGWRDLKR